MVDDVNASEEDVVGVVGLTGGEGLAVGQLDDLVAVLSDPRHVALVALLHRLGLEQHAFVDGHIVGTDDVAGLEPHWPALLVQLFGQFLVASSES